MSSKLNQPMNRLTERGRPFGAPVLDAQNGSKKELKKNYFLSSSFT